MNTLSFLDKLSLMVAYHDASVASKKTMYKALFEKGSLDSFESSLEFYAKENGYDTVLEAKPYHDLGEEMLNDLKDTITIKEARELINTKIKGKL